MIRRQTTYIDWADTVAGTADRLEPECLAPLPPNQAQTEPAEDVRIKSRGDLMAGKLFLPAANAPVPVVIVCHGAGDWKENFFELCRYLVQRGIGALALDMHGHGQSGGERYCVNTSLWADDVRAALDYLASRREVDARRIAAFGFSSGGTAVLEAALADSRLKALILLDATVRNVLNPPMALLFRLVVVAGRLKLRLTGRPLRVPLAKVVVPRLASDEEINQRAASHPLLRHAFLNFPLPGGEQAFLVNTIQRVSQIRVPTLVLWGQDDQLDPPETGRRLFEKLTCEKQLVLIPGNGHVGHLDRNRARVFELTANWVLRYLSSEVGTDRSSKPAPASSPRIIEGAAARALARETKWGLLSPFLRQYGRQALAYATLQEGMEYFIDETGYIAYTTVRHPVLARRPKRIVLSDPVCAPEALPQIIRRFLAKDPRGVFGVISEQCAEVLRAMGFKVNCLGYEPVIPVQTYNTQGNWKELDLIKRARNEAKRQGILIREEQAVALKKEELAAVSAKWLSAKRINDREIWIYARRPVFAHEPDVRKFVAYDQQGRAVGFVFYDPMYRDGRVFGYSANIVRCDEQRFGRLATAIHMVAVEKFRQEGKEALNLLMAPFVNLDMGRYNDHLPTKWFLQFMARFGNSIYNFRGLSFHKSKYRGMEIPVYYASNSVWPSNDIFLAFLSADLSRGWFSTLGQLVRGLFKTGGGG